MAVFMSLQGRECSVLPSSWKHAIVDVLRRSKSFLSVWEKHEVGTEKQTEGGKKQKRKQVMNTIMCRDQRV